VVVALRAPVLALPLAGSFPDQPPEAVQLEAFAEDQLSIADPPLLTLVGVALRLTVGATTAAFTVIANADNEADALPSLTLITTPEVVPTSAAAGVPLSCPLAVLKLAQEGWFVMEKVRALPDGSVVVGVKVYAVPTVTLVFGEPEIVGPETPAATVMANAGNEALATPSVALMTMPA
jgi:hypothetical protein